MICGAWGGRPDKDGVEAVTNPSQNLSNMPVEVMEAEHPVRIEEYAFVPDSCGAGRWRGGVGLRRSYRILRRRGAAAAAHRPRRRFQPYGLAGGEPGGASRNFIEIGDRREPLPGKVTMTRAARSADHARAGRRRRLRRSAARAIPRWCARTSPTARSRRAFAAEQHYRFEPTEPRPGTAAPDSQQRPADGGSPTRQAPLGSDRRSGPNGHRELRRRRQRRGDRRDPVLSRQLILSAAQDEFAAYGLNGARIDRIAKRAGASKNLIYHYFGSKDRLYLTVLEGIYRQMREDQDDLALQELPPLEGMRRLVANTFDHFVRAPALIRLMSIENIHFARHLKKSTSIKPLYGPLLHTIRTLLVRGQEGGVFRRMSTLSISISRCPGSPISTCPTGIRCRGFSISRSTSRTG